MTLPDKNLTYEEFKQFDLMANPYHKDWMIKKRYQYYLAICAKDTKEIERLNWEVYYNETLFNEGSFN